MYKAQPRGKGLTKYGHRDLNRVMDGSGVVDLGTILINFLMFAQVQRFKETLHVSRSFRLLLGKAEHLAFVSATVEGKPAPYGRDEDSDATGDYRPVQLECILPTTFRNAPKIKIKQLENSEGFYRSTLYLRVGINTKTFKSTMFIIPRDLQFMSEIEFFIGDGKRPERFAIMPEQVPIS